MNTRKIQRKSQIDLSIAQIKRYNPDYNLYRTYVAKGNWALFKTIENMDRYKTFADFGCLDGSITHSLSMICDKAYGFDLPEVVQEIQFAHPRVTYIGMDLDEAFPELFFDTILASNIVEHLYYDIKFIENCYNSLTDGGKLILSVPLMFHRQVEEGVCFRMYNTDDVRNMLTDTGFSIVEEDVSSHIQISLVSEK